jgi:hypothetical protein
MFECRRLDLGKQTPVSMKRPSARFAADDDAVAQEANDGRTCSRSGSQSAIRPKEGRLKPA